MQVKAAVSFIRFSACSNAFTLLHTVAVVWRETEGALGENQEAPHRDRQAEQLGHAYRYVSPPGLQVRPRPPAGAPDAERADREDQSIPSNKNRRSMGIKSTIHDNCAGVNGVFSVLPLPIPEVPANKRKGVVVSYALSPLPLEKQKWRVFLQLSNTIRTLAMVRQKGFEPPTFWFVAKHSIQLSYWRICSFDCLNRIPQIPCCVNHFLISADILQIVYF